MCDNTDAHSPERIKIVLTFNTASCVCQHFQSVSSSSVDSRVVLGFSHVSLAIHAQTSVHGTVLVLQVRSARRHVDFLQ